MTVDLPTTANKKAFAMGNSWHVSGEFWIPGDVISFTVTPQNNDKQNHCIKCPFSVCYSGVLTSKNRSLTVENVYYSVNSRDFNDRLFVLHIHIPGPSIYLTD